MSTKLCDFLARRRRRRRCDAKTASQKNYNCRRCRRRRRRRQVRRPAFACWPRKWNFMAAVEINKSLIALTSFRRRRHRRRCRRCRRCRRRRKFAILKPSWCQFLVFLESSAPSAPICPHPLPCSFII